MSDNNDLYKYGWTGWRDDYGKYHDNINDRNAANEYYRLQTQQLEELKRANKLKEQEQKRQEEFQKQLEQEEYEEEYNRKLDEFIHEEINKKCNFINEMKKVIKEQNKKVDDILELRNELKTNQFNYFKDAKILKRNLQNYNIVMNILNRNYENDKDKNNAINKIKETILTFDLDFSAKIMGKFELTLEDYKVLVNDEIKNLKNKIKKLENMAYHQKLLLSMVSSKYCTLDKYNSVKNYINNINYEDEYYKFLKEDSDLDKQREEQIELRKQQIYDNRIKKEELKKEKDSINKELEEIDYKAKIDELQNQFYKDNQYRERKYNVMKIKCYLIYGLLLTLITISTAFVTNIITLVILVIYGIFGYKYIVKNKLNQSKEEFDVVKNHKKEKLEKETSKLLNELEIKTNKLKELEDKLNNFDDSHVEVTIKFGDFIINNEDKSLDNMHNVEFIADRVCRNNIESFKETLDYPSRNKIVCYEDYKLMYDLDKNCNK